MVSTPQTTGEPDPVDQFTYQVHVVIGEPVIAPAAARVVTLRPESASEADVLAQVAGAALSSADMRSRVLVEIGGAPAGMDALVWRDTVVVTYAALTGFARRRLDVSDSHAPLVMVDVDAAFRALVDAGRPEQVAELVTVGQSAAVLDADVAHVPFVSRLSTADVTLLRWARRVLWSPPGDPLAAVTQLVSLAGLRARGEADRFPALLCADATVTDLSGVRRSAELMRASRRTDSRSALAPAAMLTARQLRLCAAASAPMESVLEALGARYSDVHDESTGETVRLWHCLHPQNHTNGDATPSARLGPIPGGLVGFRCLRCLPERVDPLRLVMWAESLPVDDAADLIESWDLPAPDTSEVVEVAAS